MAPFWFSSYSGLPSLYKWLFLPFPCLKTSLRSSAMQRLSLAITALEVLDSFFFFFFLIMVSVCGYAHVMPAEARRVGSPCS